jgi:uncharacterized protein (TIRG00374 family)
MESSPTPASSTSPPRAAWKWFIRLGLGILIVTILLRQAEGADLGRVMRQVSPAVLLGSLLAYCAGQLLSAWRWQLLLNAARPTNAAPLSLTTCARIYFIGMFWNLWMPTSIGGDAARSYLAGQRGIGLGAAATSVFMDRFVGMIGLLLICCAGLLVQVARPSAETPTMQAAWRVVGIAVLCALLGLMAVVLLARSKGGDSAAPPQSTSTGWRAKLAGLQELLANYAQPGRRMVLASALLLSFGVQILQIIINIGLARTVGLPIPAATLWWVTPTLALSTVLPLGIGGLGVREAAAVALLHSADVPVGMVVAWSLLWQAIVWLSSLLGGVLSLGLQARKPS